jgi:phage baseplate assembly protein W
MEISSAGHTFWHNRPGKIRAADRRVDLPAPNNSTTIAVVVQTVREALVAFEPRIDVLDISAESAPEEPNLLLIRINYRIRANNARGNLVYPFYIQESA